jgi:hypothetical protein
LSRRGLSGQPRAAPYFGPAFFIAGLNLNPLESDSLEGSRRQALTHEDESLSPEHRYLP